MINGINIQNPKSRLRKIQKEVAVSPFSWDSGKNATEVALANNFALEEVLKNQQTIIENQNKIIRQLSLGNKLNIQA